MAWRKYQRSFPLPKGSYNISTLANVPIVNLLDNTDKSHVWLNERVVSIQIIQSTPTNYGYFRNFLSRRFFVHYSLYIESLLLQVSEFVKHSVFKPTLSLSIFERWHRLGVISRIKFKVWRLSSSLHVRKNCCPKMLIEQRGRWSWVINSWVKDDNSTIECGTVIRIVNKKCYSIVPLSIR